MEDGHLKNIVSDQAQIEQMAGILPAAQMASAP
jgi:hypothetical protein